MAKIILQNNQRHNRQRPTRQLHKGKSYRIDLDDMLLDNEVDTSMVKWCQHRREDGADLSLWSTQGKEHAREKAQQMGILSVFTW